MSDTLRSLFSGSKSGGSQQGDDDSATTSSVSSREVRPDVTPGADIRVLGAGGGGSNAIKRMMDSRSRV